MGLLEDTLAVFLKVYGRRYFFIVFSQRIFITHSEIRVTF